jgi:hypothetical protein
MIASAAGLIGDMPSLANDILGFGSRNNTVQDEIGRSGRSRFVPVNAGRPGYGCIRPGRNHVRRRNGGDFGAQRFGQR